MTKLRIFGKKSVRGVLRAPGDKSISHRSAILGSIARGTTRVEGFLKGDDTLRTLSAFRDMGVEWRWEGERLIIKGHGREGLSEPGNVIDLGNSGTGIRLLTGLVSGLDQYTVLTGDESLRSRPMGRVVEPLRRMGARIDGRNGGKFAPLSIHGGNLKGLTYELPVASAQLKSALLLASLWAEGPTELREPGPARDHTEIMLEGFGARVEKGEGGWLRIRGDAGNDLVGREITVPGDISSAAFFLVAALITQGGELTVRRVGVNPTRTGALDILREMGAEIELSGAGSNANEQYADITARHSELKGATIKGDQVVRAIDEFPILAVAAAFALGKTVIEDAEELRVKESDRIAAMAQELIRMGASIEERPNGMIINGGKPLKGAEVSSHGDHRVAMSLAVAALGAEGETVISDTECIATSFPGFEKLLEEATAG